MNVRTSRSGRLHALAIACAGAMVLAACDGGAGGGAGTTDQDSSTDGGGGFLGLGGDDEEQEPALSAELSAPEDEALVLEEQSADGLAVGVSSTLFESSPVVVIAAADQQVRGASAGVALGVPVLVDGPSTGEEIERLATEVALVLGEVEDPGVDVVAPADEEELAELLGIEADAVTVDAEEAGPRVSALDPAAPELLTTDEELTPSSLEGDRGELPDTEPARPAGAVTLLSTGEAEDLAALGTARAAGAEVVVTPHADPRATSETVQALAEAPPETVIGLGEDFGDAEDLAWRTRTAATGVELPGGGQLTLPGKQYIALYGSPGVPALGVLGEQSPQETIARAEEHAAWYEDLTDETVIPTHEIIVTVASTEAGADGAYSNELPVSQIEPLVDLAERHGHYVVLDLQPGRTDFVTQAQRYEELLVRPHVGLALDPEWRLRPDQQHLQEIGQVSVEEVDEVITYLADLTREHDLPQKTLVLHMFQNRMIPDVDEIDRSRSEVAVLIHADGQGTTGDKHATWDALHNHAPSMEFWGWKNFYDEDAPMLSPEETMDQVDPPPDFISYQ